MRVFKFGGISIADSTSIKNTVEIIRHYQPEMVVVSAMGKMTNAFESLVEAHVRQLDAKHAKYQAIRQFHLRAAQELFGENKAAVSEVESLLNELKSKLDKSAFVNYQKTYDQIVPYGELLSSTILSLYLAGIGIENQWLDARKWLITDNHYQEARVDDERSGKLLEEMADRSKLNLTQGFIGGCDEGFSTTLGREGSDYTAALIASYLKADSVTVWKDVPGLLNADPNIFEDTVMLSHISYNEAVELAFYGAKVIHPKTIKPLQNANIPLYVRSFNNMKAAGTVIDNETTWDEEITSFILKKNQILLSLRTKDFSFMAEDHLHYLYGQFSSHGLKANLMQNSAITLSVCFDENLDALGTLLGKLARHYEIRYNKGLDLLTLRHYNDVAIRKATAGRNILLDQRSRVTAQIVMR